MEVFDELWRGGPRFMQTEQSFKLSTDSVLLSDFANMKRVKSCLDLGSGAGVLCVLLAVKNPNAIITGIEIQPDFAELSRRNLSENGMELRTGIINADLRECRSLIKAESFDLVVSNPPYFAENSGYSAPASHRASAREEKNCTLAELCAAAKWALRWGGSFALVHRPERLSEVLCEMTEAGIEPKRLRMVSHSALKAPSLVLVEGRRGGGKGLKIEAPLILTNADGSDTDEAQKIYKRGAYAPQEKEMQL
ncbi:MAG: methyltransferase [Oscillospiraceae bacterium]